MKIEMNNIHDYKKNKQVESKGFKFCFPVY